MVPSCNGWLACGLIITRKAKMSKRQRRQIKQLIYVMVVLVISGCGSTGVARMSTADVQAKPKDCKLDVFDSEADVKHKFAVLCRIDAETGPIPFHRHGIEAAMDRLRPKACECGADAVIILDVKKPDALSTFLSGYRYSNIKANAIRYTE